MAKPRHVNARAALGTGRLGLALFLSLLFLIAFAWVAWCGDDDTQTLVGFYMIGVGGIGAAFGELLGSGFGSGRDRHRGAWLRASGFVGLTLGALLLALPVANDAFSKTEALSTRYTIASLLLFIFALLAGIIAFWRSREDIKREEAKQQAQEKQTACGAKPDPGDHTGI